MLCPALENKWLHLPVQIACGLEVIFCCPIQRKIVVMFLKVNYSSWADLLGGGGGGKPPLESL
jgi:hypothetical protein